MSWSAPCSTLTVLASANMGPSAPPATAVLRQVSKSLQLSWMLGSTRTLCTREYASLPMDFQLPRLLECPTAGAGGAV